MERNQDPNVVVMAREFYEQLVGTHTTLQDLKRIDKHVRKFNPLRQAPHQDSVRRGERRRSDMIVQARRLVGRMAGKMMYAKVKYGHEDINADCPLAPVIIKRVNEQRHLVDAKLVTNYTHRFPRPIGVSPSMLVYDLPNDYIPGVGEFADYFVKAGSKFDLREVNDASGS